MSVDLGEGGQTLGLRHDDRSVGLGQHPHQAGAGPQHGAAGSH